MGWLQSRLIDLDDKNVVLDLYEQIELKERTFVIHVQLTKIRSFYHAILYINCYTYLYTTRYARARALSNA
jgi:hypothetical protein